MMINGENDNSDHNNFQAHSFFCIDKQLALTGICKISHAFTTAIVTKMPYDLLSYLKHHYIKLILMHAM